ncbi:phenylalanyl-tRNAsynthetase alpha chain, related [Neospora caninum Liverpool]|nr:phenylalanyl-tRNAsynthetase alpha chain, related [Neospora caninum Liverpool]CBZ50741.1 phenylalanyl-tRNAsynthetase alpha chain, related [Neospora caninum Liverpool]|eukprot:XP_003880774.1 phenylalanyl-tRNAsynthetase alpha chain, related [Neospora caninum Liverpool]
MDSLASTLPSSSPHSGSDASVEASQKETTDSESSSLDVPLLAPFQLFDNFSPFVTCKQNFDSLLVPLDHVSRLPSDTYYVDNGPPVSAGKKSDRFPPTDQEYNPNRILLRTHCTAHQRDLIDAGIEAAVWTAEVIRRDEIDRLHYPVFHQTDGFRLFSEKQLQQLEYEHQLLLKAVSKFAGDHNDASRDETIDGNKQIGGDDVGTKALEAWIRGSPCLTQANPFLNNPVTVHLQLTLERLLKHLLGSSVRMKWDYETAFPFTAPSVELYVAKDMVSAAAGEGAGGTDERDLSEEWIEVLGAGEIRPEILQDRQLLSPRVAPDTEGRCEVANMGNAPSANSSDHRYRGWAFGLGLERLCMHLFGIEDIRLFWSKDPRFSEQFADGGVRRFVPFSNMPPVYKDISFWVNETTNGTVTESEAVSIAAEKVSQQQQVGFSPSIKGCGQADAGRQNSCAAWEREQRRETFSEMSFYELCRESGGDLVESVKLVDSFVHPKTRRLSRCYRLTYRAIDRTLTHEEVNAIQEEVYRRTGQMFDVELR